MASKHPLGALVSWVGGGASGTISFNSPAVATPTVTPTSGLPSEVSHGYVNMDELHLLGSVYQVDPFGSGPAPKIYTMTWTLRLIDRTSSMVAFTNLRNAYNAMIQIFDTLDGSGNSGQKGVLTAQTDVIGSGTVACTARLSKIPIKLTAVNTHFIEVPLVWIVLSDWG